MTSNETVTEIVKQVRRECNSYPLPANAAEMLRLVREIKTAHEREIAAKDAEIAELRESLTEAVNNECNYCRTVRKDGTYGKCEHLRADGKCDHLRGVNCIVHKWRKALEGVRNETK